MTLKNKSSQNGSRRERGERQRERVIKTYIHTYIHAYIERGMKDEIKA